MRREERSEDRQNTERMFTMAMGGMANYFSESNKYKITKVPIKNDYSIGDDAEGEQEYDEQATKGEDLSDLDSFGEVMEKVDLSRKR